MQINPPTNQPFNTMETDHNQSCVWLRNNGLNDPKYSIDLTRIMCSECNVGNESCCKRADEAVMLVIASQRQQKRSHAKKRARHSYDKSHVSSTGRRKGPEKKEKKIGALNDCTNLTLNAIQRKPTTISCRAPTPSKISERHKRKVVDNMAEGLNGLTEEMFPKMNQIQRDRMVGITLRANAKKFRNELEIVDEVGDVEEARYTEETEDPCLLVDALKAFRPFLSDLKPEHRRPQLAAFASSMQRKAVEKALHINISQYEWGLARMHARYPGALKPVQKIKHHRICIPKDSIIGVFDFLDDYLQGHAFGMNEVKLSNGETLQLDAVSTTANNSKLVRDWACVTNMIALSQTEIPADENRCIHRCKKSRSRCLLVKGHAKKQHKYTPDNSISPSSLERIVNTIGNGNLKSLAGLDDEDVMKGAGNFKRLHEIHDLLANAISSTPHAREKLKNEIDDSLLFHKTDFKKHLLQGKKVCQCISCGFSSPKNSTAPKNDDEPIVSTITAPAVKKSKAKAKAWATTKIKAPSAKQSKAAEEKEAREFTECLPCKLHDDNLHEGPCSGCEKSFEIFSTLLNMARVAQNLQNISTSQLELFSELEFELKKRREYHIHWRSHIVRKKTESDFDRKQMQSLKQNEVIVISDYKMKILSCFHRETQKQFFAKRGTTCLGFMSMKKSIEDEEDLDVHFHLLFSDDTTQDSHFVLAAKAYIYNEFLPTQFPPSTEIDAHFRADGAGCFNSNLVKTCTPLWKIWTDGKVNEKSCRISVNGGGKTSLDACFGKLSSNLKQGVANGCGDITDANSCIAVFEAGPGIRGATAATFEPVREVEFETTESRLKQYHMIEMNEDGKSMQCYSHSGYGNGFQISAESIKKNWVRGEIPKMPRYIATTQTETSESNENASHKIESKQSRDKKAKTSRAEAQHQKMHEQWNNSCDVAFRNRLFKCRHHSSGKGFCKRSFLSKKGLANHVESGKHSYLSNNLRDTAALIASDPGGILRAGSRRNRSDEYGLFDVSDGTGEGVLEGKSWYSKGCYRKPGRAKPQRKTEVLKNQLNRMFLDGEKTAGSKKNAQHYTPLQALNELRGMKNEHGMLMFSTTSLNGPLPTEDQIKAYWSNYKNKQKKKNAALLEDEMEV